MRAECRDKEIKCLLSGSTLGNNSGEASVHHVVFIFPLLDLVPPFSVHYLASMSSVLSPTEPLSSVFTEVQYKATMDAWTV